MEDGKRYLNHPRFGDVPIISGHSYTEEQILKSHWRYASVKFIKETAIPADISRQKYSLYPRKIYVDIEKVCESCRRPFIFFAQEQKHWFETLGFWVDADCTRCINCRKQDQSIRSMQVRYQELVGKGGLTEPEVKELRKIALELYQLGYIRDPRKVDNIG